MLSHDFFPECFNLKLPFNLHLLHHISEYIELLHSFERLSLLISELTKLLNERHNDLSLLLRQFFIIFKSLSQVEPYFECALLWLLEEEGVQAGGEVGELGEERLGAVSRVDQGRVGVGLALQQEFSCDLF